MKLKGKIISLELDYITHRPKLTIQLNNQMDILTEEFNELQKEEVIDIELKKHREKRSLDSNAYLWILCQKIAEKVPNTTKEIVYRKAIGEVGKFEILPIKNEAVETFINAWQYKGLGWICERIGDSKFNGYTNVIAYYGSSTYDTKAMSKLLDNVIYEAKELGIETLPPDEVARLNSIYNVSNNKL